MAILQAQGVSIPVVYDAILAAPSRIFLSNGYWFVPMHLMRIAPLWALAGLGTAIFTAWKQPTPGTAAWHRLFAGKTVFALVGLVAILFQGRLLTIVTPFAWLVLFDPDQANRETGAFPRCLLSILTVLQSLYAYPVAGSQSWFIEVLLATAVIVCAGDSLSWLTESWGSRERLVPWRRVAVTIALAGVTLAQMRMVEVRYREYRSLPSLDLPGARLVHIEPEEKASLHGLVQALKQRCDSFESLPGFPSLNFWSGIEPLTGLNSDAWIFSFSPQQQRRVVAALSSHPKACIVYHERLAAFWNPGGHDLGSLPLVHYIRQEFKPAMASGEYQLLIRKERMESAGGR
jgi:hypothetical protein